MHALLWTVLWVGGVPEPVAPIVEPGPAVVQRPYAPERSGLPRRARRPELYAILQHHSHVASVYDYRLQYDTHAQVFATPPGPLPVHLHAVSGEPIPPPPPMPPVR